MSIKRDRTWFPTYTGQKIDLRKFDASKIDIRDIAHHLSLTARFGGATERISSVAQHSVLVSKYVGLDGGSLNDCLWGLMHDAAEAYMGDMMLGVKSLFPRFKSIEDRLLSIIVGRYNLSWPIPNIVDKWDWIVGCNEAFTFIKGGSPKFFNVDPVPKIFMTLWTSKYAEETFLHSFDYLTKRLSGNDA